jgi:hypothetical protein
MSGPGAGAFGAGAQARYRRACARDRRDRLSGADGVCSARRMRTSTRGPWMRWGVCLVTVAGMSACGDSTASSMSDTATGPGPTTVTATGDGDDAGDRDGEHTPTPTTGTDTPTTSGGTQGKLDMGPQPCAGRPGDDLRLHLDRQQQRRAPSARSTPRPASRRAATAPPRRPANPSRTSVNQYGDVAVSSRDPGSIIKIAPSSRSASTTTTTADRHLDRPQRHQALGSGRVRPLAPVFPLPRLQLRPAPDRLGGRLPGPRHLRVPTPRLWGGWKDNAEHGPLRPPRRRHRHGPRRGPAPQLGRQRLRPLRRRRQQRRRPLRRRPRNDPGSTSTPRPWHPRPNLPSPATSPATASPSTRTATSGSAATASTACITTRSTRRSGTRSATAAAGCSASRPTRRAGSGARHRPLPPGPRRRRDQEVRQRRIPLPGCNQPWGASIDNEGFVWIVDKGNKAFKVNPDTYTPSSSSSWASSIPTPTPT